MKVFPKLRFLVIELRAIPQGACGGDQGHSRLALVGEVPVCNYKRRSVTLQWSYLAAIVNAYLLYNDCILFIASYSAIRKIILFDVGSGLGRPTALVRLINSEGEGGGTPAQSKNAQ
jgi:hypothetical protein